MLARMITMLGLLPAAAALAGTNLRANQNLRQVQDVVYSINCMNPQAQTFTYNLDTDGNLYQLAMDQGAVSEKRFITSIEDYGDEALGQLLASFDQKGARYYSVIWISYGEPPTYHIETRWSGAREGADRQFNVIRGRIAKDGRDLERQPLIPRYQRCEFDAPATVKLYQLYFPRWDYQAEIKRIRNQLAENYRANLESARLQQREAEQCQRKIAYYEQQCATAGQIGQCMQIKGRGQIYWSEGLIAGAAGWRCH